MRRSVVCAPVLVLALAAGCGGGGGSASSSSMSNNTANAGNAGMSMSSSTSSNPMCDTSMDDMSMSDMSDTMMMCDTATPMLQTALAPPQPFVIAAKPLTAYANGATYSGTYSQVTNTGTTMFDGQVASSSNIVLTVLENGATIATQASTAYYLTSPYTPLGLTGTTNGTAYQVVFTSIDPYPSPLTAGSSGPVATGTYYTPGTNVAMGSFTETYSVVENDATTLLLTIYTSGTLNGSPVSGMLAYLVDASGNLTLSLVQVTVNGMTLNLS